jgi:hypothetical protein
MCQSVVEHTQSATKEQGPRVDDDDDGRGAKSRREDQEPGGWDEPSSRGAKPRGHCPLSRWTLKTRGEARARRLRLGACPPIGLVARQWRVAISQAPGPCVRGKSPFVSTCLARRLARGTRTGPCRLQRDEAEKKGPASACSSGASGADPEARDGRLTRSAGDVTRS